MKKLFILIGRSCSGKTTLLNYIIQKYDLHVAVSFTTRERRESEIDGKDYYFLTLEEYERKKKNNELMESIEYNGNYYGLMQESFDLSKDNITVVVKEGLEQLKENLDKIPFEIKVIKIDAPDEIIIERFKERVTRGETDEETFKKRFKFDKEAFKNIEYDYLINSEFFLIDAIMDYENVQRKK